MNGLEQVLYSVFSSHLGVARAATVAMRLGNNFLGSVSVLPCTIPLWAHPVPWQLEQQMGAETRAGAPSLARRLLWAGGPNLRSFINELVAQVLWPLEHVRHSSVCMCFCS